MLVGTDNNDSTNAITPRQNSLSLHHHRQRIRTLCCPPSPSSTPHPLLTELPHRASNGFSFSLVCPTTGRSLIQCHNCRALFASRKRVAAFPGVRCLGCGALTITDESLAAACSGTAAAAASTSSPQRVSAMQTVAIQTCLAGAAEYTRVKVSQRAELLDILKLKNKAFWKAKFAEEEEAVAAATASEASPVAPALPPPPPPPAPPPPPPAPPPLPIVISRVLAKQGAKKDASSAKLPAAAKKTVGTRKEVAKSNKRKSDDATSAAGKTSTKRASRTKETEAIDGMAEMSLAPVLLAEAAAAAAAVAAAAATTSTDTLSAEAAAAASTAHNAVQTSAPSAQVDVQTVTVAAGEANASSSTAKAANPRSKNPCVAKEATAHADKLGAAKTPAVQAPAGSGGAPPAGQDIMDVDNPAAGASASKKNRRKRRSTKHKDAQAAGGGGDEEEEPAVTITTLRTNKGKRSHPGVLDPQAEPSAKRRKKGDKSLSSHGAVEAVTDGDAPPAAAASNNNAAHLKPEISMQELEVRLAVCETLLAQLADPRALHAGIVDVTPTCDVAFTSWDREMLTLTYPPPISHTVQTILHLALIIVPRPPPTATTTTRHPLHNTRDVLLAATATANNPLPSTPRAARLMAAFTCDAGVAFQIAAAPVLRAMEAVGREIEDAVMGIARWSGLARGESGCSDGDGDSAAGAGAATEVEEESVGDEVALALALDEKPARCVEDEARQQRLVTRLGLLRKLYRYLTQMAVPGAGGPG
ncbi:hypothetical protein HDU90_006060 [Geranomyces variabilis]|nr:hypothetical protein HDU90_006060 [Geranomyces variabilis]